MAIADEKLPRAASGAEAKLDAFLLGLRVAWKEGEVRPTRRPEPSKPRYRTVPDPLAEVTEQMKAWFNAEPGITGKELLDRLQAADPKTYPDKLIRTVKRRVNLWRREHTRTLVLGPAVAVAVQPSAGNIPMRQRQHLPGTFLHEAIRRPKRLTVYNLAKNEEYRPANRRGTVQGARERGNDATGRTRRMKTLAFIKAREADHLLRA